MRCSFQSPQGPNAQAARVTRGRWNLPFLVRRSALMIARTTSRPSLTAGGVPLAGSVHCPMRWKRSTPGNAFGSPCPEVLLFHSAGVMAQACMQPRQLPV